MEDTVKNNHWAEVAGICGVELGEEFNIVGCNNNEVAFSPYTITEDGFLDRNGDRCPIELHELISGKITIQQKPWKPKDGQQYWFFWNTRSVGANMFNSYLSLDILNYKFGNCFRTEEEAMQNRDKVIEMLNSAK
ncbi:MAG: hypothetical protein VB018_13220 [Lachnospiraceae bacterium]|nr:hypothetical protein [Lachnospiraceae bacterium]